MVALVKRNSNRLLKPPFYIALPEYFKPVQSSCTGLLIAKEVFPLPCLSAPGKLWPRLLKYSEKKPIKLEIGCPKL